ncbi:MAG: hypothetical protein IT534_02145 [Bauldia sp.]|jgi:hypothetical protein|nr:hypothetical protein [Bauldia sp.]
MATETLNIDLAMVRGVRALQPVTNAEDWILVLNVSGTPYIDPNGVERVKQ